MAKEFTVGRSPENDIVLAYPFLSTHHAVIRVSDNDRLVFHIKDLDSTNGVFKNGESIDEANFELSDKILLGSYTLQPSDFLPLYYSKKTSKKTASVKGSQVSHSLTTVALLSVIGVLLYFLADKNLSFDREMLTDRILFFSLGLWVLLLLLFQMFQSVRRNARIKKAENAYLDFVKTRWDKQIEIALEAQKERTSEKSAWNGFRKFELLQRVDECKNIVSFYLKSHDGLTLPSFHPGQYLTFKLSVDGGEKSLIRCYSLSDSPNDNYYRVSIKRLYAPSNSGLPDGLGSSFFHRELQVGDTLDVKAPGGKFYLDFSRKKSIVFLAGGIGVTPLLSMLNTLIDKQFTYDVWFFYGVRNSDEHFMKDHLKKISVAHDNVNLRTLYSKALPQDKQGLVFDQTGRLNVDYIKQELPSNNYDFYLCGPARMMADLGQQLEDWGVPKQDIYSESFGPSKILPAVKTNDNSLQVKEASSDVKFSRSNKTLKWSEKESSILALAEKNGVELDSACRAGNCGTCQVSLQEGKVKYAEEPGFQPESGFCLPCVGVPDGNVVLKA